MSTNVDLSINDRIASETKILHERNNKIASLKMVLALRSAEMWREYVLTFYWLFEAFEEEATKIREGGEEHLRRAFDAVYDPLLSRTEKIRQDIMFYYDDDKRVLDNCKSAEGRAYIAHVRQIAQDSPVRLLAYFSVMYLGLFAGGQIIKSKIIRRTGFYPSKRGLSHETIIERGTNIFTFDTDDTTKLKKTHRARFDRVCLEYLTPSERDAICDEAKEIFIRNETLIASVNVPNTFTMLLQTFRIPIIIILTILIFLIYLVQRSR